MKLPIISFILILLSFSCNNDSPSTDAQAAENFLNQVVDKMQENSIHKYEINWTEFREKVFEKAANPQTIFETYKGIKEALTLLGDHHSFFIKPDGGIFLGYTPDCFAPNNFKPTLPSDIGYVKIDPFSGSSNSSEALNFSQDIQDQLRTSDHDSIKGWIVDLRGNSGGNMWPMLSGIGPLLGDGIAGYFVDPDSNKTYWAYATGPSNINGNTVTPLLDSYQLINPNPKVAVLLDKKVASSGEVIAISFIGKENTKSFGSTTCGQSTANSSFTFSDGSTLYLTVAYLADRNLNLYGTPIEPDEEINNQEIIQSAVEWIEN